MSEEVPSIHEINVITGRDGDTLVHRIINTFIPFGDPISQPIGILLYYIDGAVSRSSIDNNVFYITIRLFKYRIDCFLNYIHTVITHSDYRNLHRQIT